MRHEQICRLFDDGFINYGVDYCGLLVVSVINRIFRMCAMRLKVGDKYGKLTIIECLKNEVNTWNN